MSISFKRVSFIDNSYGPANSFVLFCNVLKKWAKLKLTPLFDECRLVNIPFFITLRK